MNNSEFSKERSFEIATVFLKLGFISFGGPAAHIAMMEDEIVRKRGWVSHEQFLDLLSATNFIPGPNSTEMAIHLGLIRGGLRGLLVAGLCFILPAATIVLILAHYYALYGNLPVAQEILYGIKPVIIAVVVQAVWSLAKSAVKNKTLAIVGIISLAANFLGVNELVILALSGFFSYFFLGRRSTHSLNLTIAANPMNGLGWVGATAALAAAPFSLSKLFFFFLKVGSVLFGSGYVLLAFLRADLVDNWHWLTQDQLLDAISVGQFTPGPVFTTATFIGYLLGGMSGASLATLGIFLPSFVFVALSAPLIPKLRKSRTARSALDGVNTASLAMMVVACLYLGKSAIVDGWTLALAVVSAILLLKYRVNSLWLIIVGGLIGLSVSYV